MNDGTSGAFVISWAQTAIDDVAGPSPEEVRAGASWRWVGQALRLDGPDRAAHLGLALGWEELHARAARIARRLCAPVVPLATPAAAKPGDDPLLDRGFVLTDGRSAWAACRIETGLGRPALLAFHGSLPPQGVDLWIVNAFSNRRAEARAGRRPEAPVAGIAIGSLIETPDGARPVEGLQPGDTVITRDGGPATIVGRSRRRFTASDLSRAPEDRAVRVSVGAFGGGGHGEDLRVGPDQHLLFGGKAVWALFGAPDVLVRARDLLDHPGVSLDLHAHEVTYVHILLERHHILTAHGMGCASFHPDMAAAPGEALLEPGLLHRIGPDILGNPHEYGPPVRRRLTGAEAALLVAGGDLRAVA
ncbi:Hint domain-containing protein [Tropicimonas isoalkanivorans]|uniref:Hint domain-containing protein n=1 Tax=Tropicimonas isoalkanivorans TaxID=441112 RepID=A0A1I1PUC7_9RHOB|nr:Hint domain-containing protein [Tropicimonas isoalkanivorans]SFD13242.1 Hint domain-containing protein [Tropicimonas isoalkanivorans]